MKKEAVPVKSSNDYVWEEIDTFGKTPEDIASNISKKWLENIDIKNSIFDLDGVWFAKPIPNSKCVKLLESK